MSVARCVALGCVLLAACDRSSHAAPAQQRVADGDANRGRALVAHGEFGCTACHDLPDLRAPHGVVGPPLRGIARGSFIAGQLPNTPDVLVAFLENPAALVPATGMPDVRLSAQQARDIAAYLYALGPADAR
jgi:cytochrome c2